MSDGASEPWVLHVPEESARIRGQLSELTAKGGLVHHLAARDLMTEQGVFRTFAQTLRFPGYFGWNWDALVDCLGDLCGEVTGGGAGIVGVVHDADRLLWTGHFPLLVSVLCQAPTARTRPWTSAATPWTGPPSPNTSSWNSGISTA
ncbi:barstar family protein [Streptomyces sp. NPDC091215]|uniref:barstar family protein n=1 Tax=Streptomyces sp. NPDC091215 TaxID=3155192 RepID=UPI00343EA366